MSRCFPFPPPGYEKKPTTDEPDLIKKEKRKEKKHKKDKKDKEKKDGKEKREKDRSEGKHKEKKEKKDKHRDKKKDKSRNSTPDEKKILGLFEGYNGEKPHHNNEHNKNGEFNEQLQKKEEFTKEKSIPFRGQNGISQNGISVQSRVKVGDAENFKFVQELDRRIRDEEKGMGSHQFAVDVRKSGDSKVEMQKSVGRQSIMEVAGFGGNVAVLGKINGISPTPPPPMVNKIDKRIDKMQEKGSDDKRGDKRKHKDRDKERQGKNKDREKEKSEKSEEKSERKKAERDKNKHMQKIDSFANANPNNVSIHPLENSLQGVGNEGNIKKRKDMETNGVSHESEPRPNKMVRPISNIPPENGRKLDSLQKLSPSLLDKRVASLNNFKVGSQGGQKVNGMIPSQPVSLPAKKPPIPGFNHVPSKPSPIKSPPVITNHVAVLSPPVPLTKPQPNHIPAQLPTFKPPPSVPNIIPAQPPPLSSSLPPPPSAKQPVSRPKPPPQPPAPVPKKKAPHPDTKYLNQILSVPKLDPWCDYDDQEWLFSSKSGQPSSKKPSAEEVEVQLLSEIFQDCSYNESRIGKKSEEFTHTRVEYSNSKMSKWKITMEGDQEKIALAAFCNVYLIFAQRSEMLFANW